MIERREEVTIEEMLRHKEVGEARDAMYRGVNAAVDGHHLDDKEFGFLLRLSKHKLISLVDLQEMTGLEGSILLLRLGRLSKHGYVYIDAMFCVWLTTAVRDAITNANHQWENPQSPPLC